MCKLKEGVMLTNSLPSFFSSSLSKCLGISVTFLAVKILVVQHDLKGHFDMTKWTSLHGL